jgi:hypothetical protein
VSSHLSDQRMMDIVEGGGSPPEWAHVASCAGVPDPPGLYWEVLRRNVSRRIAEEPSHPARWGWLAPLAALGAAVVVIAVSLGRPGADPSATVSHLPAWTALPPAQDDEELAVVSGVADEALADWDEGLGLGAFVAGLTDEESEALVAALRLEGPEGEL